MDSQRQARRELVAWLRRWEAAGLPLSMLLSTLREVENDASYELWRRICRPEEPPHGYGEGEGGP